MKNWTEGKSLGERLYLLREERRMTQEELAEKLIVSRQTISNWENDKVTLDVEKAAELSRLYGVSMDELFLAREQGGAAEQSEQKEKFEKGSKLKSVAAIVLFALGVILIILSVVFLIVGKDEGQISSAVILSGKAAWALGLCAGLVVCVALGIYLIKRLRK